MGQSLLSLSKQLFAANCTFQYRQPCFRWSKGYFYPLVYLLSLLFLSTPGICRAELSNDRFGKINIYRDKTEPSGVVVFFSGEHGFDSLTEGIATEISKAGFLVIGVNAARYLEGVSNEDKDEDCSYLAGEITRLSQAAQNTEKLSSYKKPLLMGIGSGAALAYAVAAQYPDEFKALVTLGFCPKLITSPALCQGEGLKTLAADKEQSFNANSAMQLAWRDFSSSQIFNCPVRDISAFFSKEKDQSVMTLPQKKESPTLEAVTNSQITGVLQEFSRQGDSPDSDLEDAISDLPLIELFPEERLHESLMLIVSGDGGWATIDKELGEYFKSQGYAVVGFNALRYFWQKKGPDQTAFDINRVIRFYRTKLGIDHISLLGFSFGADILPFVVNRLSQDNLKDVSLVTLLSPGKTSDFEIHVADWLGIESPASSYNITAEIQRITKNKVLCIYGTEDEDQTCSLLNPKLFKLSALPGDHHFDGDYEKVARIIIENDSR